MQIRSVRALRGPNIWSRQPCLEALVDLGPLKDLSSELLPDFNDRLMGWLPGMIEHRCSVGERGGFFVRLRRGTYLAHILEHVTLELQTLAGTAVGFGRARETSEEGVYKVAIRYAEESVGRAALEVAHRLCLAAVYDLPFDLNAEVAKLRELADRVCLGPSTQAIVSAALARNIPFRRLNTGSLVQLGQGARQRRIWTAETDSTSAIAESIAQDKDLTKSILRAAGVPVPEGREVKDPDDAWEASQEIDGPVVVKPIDANHGRGVCMNLETEEEIRHAFGVASLEGSGVLVERFAPGSEHRLLVVGDRLVAASRGDAAKIEGDGVHTVADLIASQVNSDPRRGEDEIFPLSTVHLDDQVVLLELKKQGYVPESIPPAGQTVIVRRNDNLSIDATDEVHPLNAEHAVLAAKVVGLDIAGVDIVAEDISRPLEEQGGAIVEVNAGPGLLMHLRPAVGKPRPVGEAIVERMFPIGSPGRIPLVCVTGVNGKTTTTRLIATILRQSGLKVGTATSDGIVVDDRVIEMGDCAGPKSARAVLLNPTVEAAVLEAGRGGILREGLGFDKCDVAVVTNLSDPDHLGEYDIKTVEKMYSVKRTPVDVVMPSGFAVLNAADPWVAKMASLSAGGVIFFSRDERDPVLAQHRSEGKKVVFVRDGSIVVGDGGLESIVVRLADVTCTHGGRIGFQVDNVLASTAAAWGLKIPFSAISAGLQQFQGSLTDDPGRFNVFHLGGRTMVVSDARNTAALKATIEALSAFPSTRRLAVYAAEDDRLQGEALLQGGLLAKSFQKVFLYELPRTDQGRGASPRDLLNRGIAESEFQEGVCVDLEESWAQAVDAAWHDFRQGDLLLIQAGPIGVTIRKLQQLLGLELVQK
jgi:cyanophycin synthetase